MSSSFYVNLVNMTDAPVYLQIARQVTVVGAGGVLVNSALRALPWKQSTQIASLVGGTITFDRNAQYSLQPLFAPEMLVPWSGALMDPLGCNYRLTDRGWQQVRC